LAVSEQRYRMISEMISDYAYLVRVDADGRMKREWITEESYQRITGFTVQDLDRMLEEDKVVLEYPEELQDSVRDHLERAIEGEANSQEMYFIPKEQQAKRWLHVCRQPIRDGSGAITHLLGVAQDITARKEAEVRLRESEERYRALSELMSDYAFFIRVEEGQRILEWMTTRLNG
jgi:PAS domain S-box-containing protein